MGAYLSGIIIGVIGSILAAILLGIFFRGTNFFYLLISSFTMAMRLRREGLTSFQLRREHYPGRLPAYLSSAIHSIVIISISFKLTSDEGAVLEVLKSKIEANPDFHFSISLLDPNSAAIMIMSASLNIPSEQLHDEICSMLQQLVMTRNSLREEDKYRMQVLIHGCIPMGSAILLDATPEKGIIQVETKLFRAPRTESFGYQVKGPSLFYSRNYRAWTKVITESRPVKDLDYTRPFLSNTRIRKTKAE